MLAMQWKFGSLPKLELCDWLPQLIVIYDGLVRREERVGSTALQHKQCGLRYRHGTR